MYDCPIAKITNRVKWRLRKEEAILNKVKQPNHLIKSKKKKKKKNKKQWGLEYQHKFALKNWILTCIVKNFLWSRNKKKPIQVYHQLGVAGEAPSSVPTGSTASCNYLFLPHGSRDGDLFLFCYQRIHLGGWRRAETQWHRSWHTGNTKISTTPVKKNSQFWMAGEAQAMACPDPGGSTAELCPQGVLGEVGVVS